VGERDHVNEVLAPFRQAPSWFFSRGKFQNKQISDGCQSQLQTANVHELCPRYRIPDPYVLRGKLNGYPFCSGASSRCAPIVAVLVPSFIFESGLRQCLGGDLIEPCPGQLQIQRRPRLPPLQLTSDATNHCIRRSAALQDRDDAWKGFLLSVARWQSHGFSPKTVEGKTLP